MHDFVLDSSGGFDYCHDWRGRVLENIGEEKIMADNIPQSSPISPAGGQPGNPVDDNKARELADKVGAMFKKGAQHTGSRLRLVWHDPLICIKTLDFIVERVREMLPPGILDLLTRFFSRTGYVSLVAAAPLGLVFCIVAAVKEERFSYIPYGLGFVLLLIIVQYAANKLLTANESLVLASPTVLESDSFLRCVALISEAFGMLAFLWLTVIAIQHKDLGSFCLGIGTTLLCDILAFIAIHPSLVSTSISKQTSSGEEAIGIVSFFAKAFMRLVPVFFGISTFMATLFLLVATVNLFRDKADFWHDGIGIARVLVSASLLPLAAYIGFSLYCLQVELLRSILSIKDFVKK